MDSTRYTVLLLKTCQFTQLFCNVSMETRYTVCCCIVLRHWSITCQWKPGIQCCCIVFKYCSVNMSNGNQVYSMVIVLRHWSITCQWKPGIQCCCIVFKYCSVTCQWKPGVQYVVVLYLDVILFWYHVNFN